MSYNIVVDTARLAQCCSSLSHLGFYNDVLIGALASMVVAPSLTPDALTILLRSPP